MSRTVQAVSCALVVAALSGCTAVQIPGRAAEVTTAADTQRSAALCSALQPDTVHRGLSAAAGRPVAGPFDVVPGPVREIPGEASSLACVLTTRGEEPFTVPGCVTGASQVHATIRDFSYGPFFVTYEDEDAAAEVGGATAVEFHEEAFANSALLEDRHPWERVPGGSFLPGQATLQRVIEPNNQLLWLDVGGPGADDAGGRCDAVRDLLVAASDRVVAAAGSLRP
ncbi:hypothetical protein ACI78Q_01700 [Geodermatophilus sp. SYSU D00705]